MSCVQGRSFWRAIVRAAMAAIGALLLSFPVACAARQSPKTQSPETVLRVGVSQIEVKAFLDNLTIESLAKIGEDGRIKASIATSWAMSSDGHSLIIEIRPKVRFHDGSPLSAALVADILKRGLPRSLGPASENVIDVVPVSDTKLEIALRHPSLFVIEGLETPLVNANGAGTGPFLPDGSADSAGVKSNPGYYLDPSTIQRVRVSTYPSTRAAWADMLRNRIDMVYEVGADAREAFASATTINVFSYTRHYQYLVLLNARAPALRPPAVRRALNAAINRSDFVRDALNGYGTSSIGPVWPQHWAVDGHIPRFEFDPESAVAAIGPRGLTFHCYVPPGDERTALVVRRQLQAIGVDMILEEKPIADINDAIKHHDFEAVIAPTISGPSILRPYLWWHSKGPKNTGFFASAPVDAALDTLTRAGTEEQYRQAVRDFQRTILDDPPAIFLAWDQRARAVSGRFDVTPADGGGDILGTLRLWQARPAVTAAGLN